MLTINLKHILPKVKITKVDLISSMSEKHYVAYDMERILEAADTDEKILAAIQLVRSEYTGYDITKILENM